MTKKYGFDDGFKGLEAKVVYKHGILTISILGTNHWTEVFIFIFGWAYKRGEGWVNHIWERRGRELGAEISKDFDLSDAEGVVISAHSAGAIAAQSMQKWFDLPTALITHGAPRTRGLEDGVHYKNKGDLVTLWPPFGKGPKYTVSDKPWQPVWKAHVDYWG